MAQEKVWISVDSDWLVIRDSDMVLLGDVEQVRPGNCPNCEKVDVIAIGPASRETNVVPVWCPGCGFRDY